MPTIPTIHEFATVLGRLGGLKGGPARAKKLSKKRRVEIARKAAYARWGKKMSKEILFKATDEEVAAIKELCELQELSEQQILRQALRLYQLHVKRAHGLLELSSLSKLKPIGLNHEKT